MAEGAVRSLDYTDSAAWSEREPVELIWGLAGEGVSPAEKTPIRIMPWLPWLRWAEGEQRRRGVAGGENDLKRLARAFMTPIRVCGTCSTLRHSDNSSS